MAHRKMPEVAVKGNVYILLVLLLFLVPLPWLVGWLLAVLFHECCHWCAVKLLGGEIYRITVGLGGANMESSILSDRKGILCILAGPLGGLLLVFLGRWFPRFAICSWMLSVYNLLPLMPLDGGRALQILWSNPKGFEIFEMVLLISLTGLAFYASLFCGLGVLPLGIVAVLWIKNRKRPCKEGGCKLQYMQK